MALMLATSLAWSKDVTLDDLVVRDKILYE